MKRLALITTALLFAQGAHANEFEPKIRAYLNDHILSWAENPAIVQAILAQNTANAALGQADIDAMDLAWRAEVGMSDQPTIAPVMNNAASDFLRSQVQAAAGAITEVFIMDNHGLNVAASDVTSDYWQGDEDKFSQTFAMGAGAIHISDVEFDESSQSYQAQVSLTIIDPATSAPIGAMTVGLNAEALF